MVVNLLYCYTKKRFYFKLQKEFEFKYGCKLRLTGELLQDELNLYTMRINSADYFVIEMNLIIKQ
jgi:hypothetical protein